MVAVIQLHSGPVGNLSFFQHPFPGRLHRRLAPKRRCRDQPSVLRLKSVLLSSNNDDAEAYAATSVLGVIVVVLTHQSPTYCTITKTFSRGRFQEFNIRGPSSPGLSVVGKKIVGGSPSMQVFVRLFRIHAPA